jgi:beta-galactosidase
MKLKQTLALLLMTTIASAYISIVPLSHGWGYERPFDSDWAFFKGDAPGAEQRTFDDSGWRGISVPHDWSIEGPFDENATTGGDGAYLPSGVSWYRKTFQQSELKEGKRLFVQFDGVMANSEVWINGHSLGKRPNGYVSFHYDLTPHLRVGENVLAVRSDTTAQPASRWYTGAGIYRHVWLIEKHAVMFDRWSTFVTTPKIADDAVTVAVTTTAMNTGAKARTIRLRILLSDPDGNAVGTFETETKTLAPGEKAELGGEIVVKAPLRWAVETPRLYQARVSLSDVDEPDPAATILDLETVAFGIREFRFEPATGFWLNGRNLKIKGVCLHHDGGAFGAAVPLRVWEQRLEILRSLGVNAIRTAHNPVAPEFLDLCDRMGFLVMHEVLDAWTKAKREADGASFFAEWGLIDVRDTVRRDRNHPSIILYSAGNEIHDTLKPESAKKTLASLIEVYHREDPTRPVTQALFRPNRSKDYHNGLADMLDVIGQNYREREILDAHKQNPARKIIGTENGHQSRVWTALRDNAPYAGQFIWSGIDYLGESRRWPLIATDYGIVMRDGTLRPRSYERMSWWSETPMVHLTRRLGEREPPVIDPGYETAAQIQQQVLQQKEPDLRSNWTPRDLSPHEEAVEVFSNCDEVELVLNGHSLGSLSRPEDARPRTWKVAYEAGTIRALGKNRGEVVATHELRTAGAPAALRLVADRTRVTCHWDDVVAVEVAVVDAHGVLVPTADSLVEFSLTGPGVIAAVDNGDNASHESFQAPRRSAFEGRCRVYVKASAAAGRIVLSAAASGVKSASVELEVTR